MTEKLPSVWIAVDKYGEPEAFDSKQTAIDFYYEPDAVHEYVPAELLRHALETLESVWKDYITDESMNTPEVWKTMQMLRDVLEK